MRIAIIADTHGAFLPLFNQHKGEIATADLICILGDMYKNEVQLVADFISVPIVAIHGNHDNMDTYNNKNVYMIHKIKVELNDELTMTGFEGSSKYKITQLYGYTQEESIKECNTLPICDILISHDGHFGYCGDKRDNAHCGLKGITNYIKKAKPKLVFFGHHHKNRNFKIGHTDCYNVYELGIFDIENGKVVNYQNYNF